MVGGDDRGVDRTVVCELLGSPRQRALQAVRARLHHEHPLDPARAGGGDVQHPARAGADDQERVARPQRDPVLGAQRAGERLGAGRRDRVEPVERQQLTDQRRLDADVLGEPARVERGGPEPGAQGLVARCACPAPPARRVVVDRHHVARGDARHARADLHDLADRLMPENGGQLAPHEPAVDVGAAGRRRDHAAHHLARRAYRIGQLHDDRRVE
jgi:hypothetical protein